MSPAIEYPDFDSAREMTALRNEVIRLGAVIRAAKREIEDLRTQVAGWRDTAITWAQRAEDNNNDKDRGANE